MSVYKGDKLVAGSGLTAEYVRNQNILSDYEAVSFPITAQYDGELIANTTLNSGIKLSVNGVEIGWAVYVAAASTGNSVTITIKKGDVIASTEGSYKSAYARWYKLRDYTGR